MPATNLSKNIKFLRKEKKETQAGLAFKLNKKHTSIGNWETGFNEPSISDLMEIAAIFGVSVDDLLNIDLSDVNLMAKKVTPKMSENVNLNVNPSVNLNAKKEVKEEKLNQLGESETEYGKKPMNTPASTLNYNDKYVAFLEKRLAELELQLQQKATAYVAKESFEAWTTRVLAIQEFVLQQSVKPFDSLPLKEPYRSKQEASAALSIVENQLRTKKKTDIVADVHT